MEVDYYGTPTPINQVANITVEEARTLVVSPWEKRMLPEIEKAILKSDLGLTPATAGDVIRLPLPPLTEENRRDLIRQARQEAEHARGRHPQHSPRCHSRRPRTRSRKRGD